jgi:hypothetical protein
MHSYANFLFHSPLVYLIHSTMHSFLWKFSSTCLSWSHTQYYPCTLVQIFFPFVSVYPVNSTSHAVLCKFSFDLSKLISFTVLSMHSCANFLSTGLSFPHTLYYQCTLRILLNYQSLSHTQFYTCTLVRIPFNLSKIVSYTILYMRSCANFLSTTCSQVRLVLSTCLKFTSYTVLSMPSCANFLSTCLSFSHSQSYTFTLVWVFFSLV